MAPDDESPYSEFSREFITQNPEDGIMNGENSSFYQDWIYPNVWFIVIGIGTIAFFFSIWLSVWLSGF